MRFRTAGPRDAQETGNLPGGEPLVFLVRAMVEALVPPQTESLRSLVRSQNNGWSR